MTSYSPPERGSFVRAVKDLRDARRAGGGLPPVPPPYPPSVLAWHWPAHLSHCDVHDVGWRGDGGCWADGADGVRCGPAAQGRAGDENEN